jgi:glycosyltransferase involved in cell wall biosynthesis/peptidoglycan/xylan/chitin deacetylase (PgdA/CDA1 family)
MIVHLFNSSSVSGPERLVLPALAAAREHYVVVNLREERIQRLRESDPLEEYARSLHLDYCDVRVCRLWDTVAVRDLRALLDRLDPDLVHAHDVKASVYLLQAQSRAQRRYRIVSTHHGVHGRPDIKTRLYEWVYRNYFLKSFDRIFSVSRTDYEDLARSGIDPAKLRLHLNGVNGYAVDFAQRSQEAARVRALWFPEDPRRDSFFLMGVIGRLSREKDHARLLAILSYLDRLPCEREWKCLIFGTGPLENDLQKEVSRLGLDRRVAWMGYREGIARELAGLDLVLSLSKAEGLPINLIEAGWGGTPVLCTAVGGIKDLIPDERYGNRIEPRESPQKTAVRIQNSLTPLGRMRLQDQAERLQQRVMADFSQRSWTDRLKELYAEVGVDMTASPLKTRHGPVGGADDSQGSFSERVQMSFLSHLLMYPTERLEDVRGWSRNGFRILMYHHFPSNEPEIQEALARQCEHLTQYYHPVSMGDIAKSLAEGTPLPPNSLAVTVDDGYRDFLCNGYPVFRSYRIPITVFLATDFIDGGFWLWWDQIRYAFENTRRTSLEISFSPDQPPLRLSLKTAEQRRHAIQIVTEAMKKISNKDRLKWVKDLPSLLDVKLPPSPPPLIAPMDWSEVRYLADNGVDFGAHTRTHPILSRLEDAELSEEIIHSKERIEEQLQRPVQHFSYPNGHSNDVNERTLPLLQSCRFQAAVTAERGVNFRGAHPFWLKRIGVDPLMSKFNFEVLLAGLGGSRSKQAPSSLVGGGGRLALL